MCKWKILKSYFVHTQKPSVIFKSPAGYNPVYLAPHRLTSVFLSFSLLCPLWSLHCCPPHLLGSFLPSLIAPPTLSLPFWFKTWLIFHLLRGAFPDYQPPHCPCEYNLSRLPVLMAACHVLFNLPRPLLRVNRWETFLDCRLPDLPSPFPPPPGKDWDGFMNKGLSCLLGGKLNVYLGIWLI